MVDAKPSAIMDGCLRTDQVERGGGDDDLGDLGAASTPKFSVFYSIWSVFVLTPQIRCKVLGLPNETRFVEEPAIE
jgi:hypothetical protein